MKNKFPFVDPQQIMTVMVAMIILAVGVFAFFATIQGTTGSGVTVGGNKCWTITTPSNPETLTGLPSNTNGITTVTEYFPDGSSNTIDATNYTWSQSTPTTIDVNVTGG